MSTLDRAPAAAAAGLPRAVETYLAAVLSDGPPPVAVEIDQAGVMWSKPGARPLHFTAVERLAVDRVAFDWRARFPLAGPLALHVLDRYADGEGRLDVRLLGLPLQHRRGPALTAGEAARYLAELPWVPWAMRLNPELEWRALDGRHVEVSTCAGGSRVAVVLTFDGADVVRATAASRPRTAGRRTEPTPWGGAFRGHRVLDGLRLPTWAEAYWELERRRFVYWRAEIRGVRTLSAR